MRCMCTLVLAICLASVVRTISGQIGSGRRRATAVFSRGDKACYRIPSLIRTLKGTLLAFAEERTSCNDNGDHNIVLRRSTDNGETWGKIITVMKGNGRSLSNPNPIEVKFGADSRAVLLHFDTKNNPTSTDHGENIQAWSDDDGQTWGDFMDIQKSMPSGYEGCMPGPSIGVQAEDGTVYFSCHGPGSGVHLYYSISNPSTKADFNTWHSSKHINRANECSVAVLANQSIAMNCRNGNTREQLTWSHSGHLLSRFNPPELIDPNCQGSLLSFNGHLYLSNPASTAAREKLTVKKSTNAGVTWGAGHEVWGGPSGYSQLMGWENTLYVLFENGDSSIKERISLSHWDVSSAAASAIV